MVLQLQELEAKVDKVEMAFSSSSCVSNSCRCGEHPSGAGALKRYAPALRPALRIYWTLNADD